MYLYMQTMPKIMNTIFRTSMHSDIKKVPYTARSSMILPSFGRPERNVINRNCCTYRKAGAWVRIPKIRKPNYMGFDEFVSI